MPQSDSTSEQAPVVPPEEPRAPTMEEAVDAFMADKLEEPEELPGRGTLSELAGDEEPPEASQSAADEPSEDAGEEPETAPEPPEQAQPKPQSEEHRKAVANLKLRGGWTDAALATLSEEEAVQTWSRLAQREADVDRAYRDLAELRQRMAQSGDTDGKGEPATPTPSADLEPAFAQLKEEFGEEAVAPLESLVSGMSSRIAQLEGQIQEQAGQAQQHIVTEARAGLGERFPDLADDESWTRVWETARALASTERYADQPITARGVSEIIERAARAEGLTESLGAAEPSKPQARSAPDDDAPTAPRQARGPRRSFSSEEREDAAIAAVVSGKAKTPADLRRLGLSG